MRHSSRLAKGSDTCANPISAPFQAGRCPEIVPPFRRPWSRAVPTFRLAAVPSSARLQAGRDRDALRARLTGEHINTVESHLQVLIDTFERHFAKARQRPSYAPGRSRSPSTPLPEPSAVDFSACLSRCPVCHAGRFSPHWRSLPRARSPRFGRRGPVNQPAPRHGQLLRPAMGWKARSARRLRGRRWRSTRCSSPTSTRSSRSTRRRSRTSGGRRRRGGCRFRSAHGASARRPRPSSRTGAPPRSTWRLGSEGARAGLAGRPRRARHLGRSVDRRRHRGTSS